MGINQLTFVMQAIDAFSLFLSLSEFYNLDESSTECSSGL